jgi:hypothetical protein
MIIIIFYDNSAPLKIQQSFTPDILSSTPFELLPCRQNPLIPHYDRMVIANSKDPKQWGHKKNSSFKNFSYQYSKVKVYRYVRINPTVNLTLTLSPCSDQRVK